MESEDLQQATPSVDTLLRHIQKLQCKGCPTYPEGLFPSQRYHTFLPYRREDSNVFFTALILFTLQGVSRFCTPDQRQLIAEITEKGVKCYPLYQSRKGLLTYNFWQNKPQKHFPHGHFLSKLKFLELPDDADDTALIYLTKPHSPEEAVWLKRELEKHANLSKKEIKNTFARYKRLKAYTTWFGKNMYLEFDFCVLCNLLYCLCHYNIPFTAHDQDTITYLREVITSEEHIHKPFQVAPSYPRTPIILYHISRLIAAFDIPGLAGIKEKVVSNLQEFIAREHLVLDKIIMATSLARLTGECPAIAYPFPIPYHNYYFFNGGMLTAFENPIAQKLAPFDIFHMKHTCEAYYLALLVEYEILKSARESRKQMIKHSSIA